MSITIIPMSASDTPNIEVGVCLYFSAYSAIVDAHTPSVVGTTRCDTCSSRPVEALGHYAEWMVIRKSRE
jgi:hypothetical protein